MSDLIENKSDGHELVIAFERNGLPLCRTLVEMLNENILHRTERRGCGFTQASRFLAAIANLPTLSSQSGGGPFRPGLERMLGGRTRLLERMREGAEDLVASLIRSESRLLAKLMISVCLRGAMGRDLGNTSPSKLPIGTCPLAEQYFLEIAYGFIRRGGYVNIIVDADDTPLLIEKCGLGDNHSCISVAPLVLNQVQVPLGSLVGVDRDTTRDDEFVRTHNERGRIIPLRSLRAVRFLRLTTLAVATADRARAFSSHFEQQIAGKLFSPESTSIEQLVDYAGAQAR